MVSREKGTLVTIGLVERLNKGGLRGMNGVVRLRCGRGRLAINNIKIEKP